MNSNLIDQKELTDELVAKLVTGLNQRMSLKAQTQERAWIIKWSSMSKKFFGKLNLTLRRRNLIGVQVPVMPDLAQRWRWGQITPKIRPALFWSVISLSIGYVQNVTPYVSKSWGKFGKINDTVISQSWIIISSNFERRKKFKIIKSKIFIFRSENI